MDVEDRKHHRRNCFARDAKRKQRNHGRCGDRVIGSLGRDNSFGCTGSERFRFLRSPLNDGVGKKLCNELADTGDNAHDHSE